LARNQAAASEFDARLSSLRVNIDSVSDLPWLGSIIHDAHVLLQTNGYLGLILIGLKPLAEIEVECGRGVYNKLIGQIVQEVIHLRHVVVRADDLICAVQPYGEEVLLILSTPRTNRQLTSTALEAVAGRIWSVLSPRVGELSRPYGGSGKFHLGYALTLPNAMIQTERLIYRAIDQARVMAEDYSRRIDVQDRERLRDLILTGQLSTVFQPIIRLQSNEVGAYEALIRGPPDSDLVSPAMLFNLAQRTGLLAELDRACCECAISSAEGLPDNTLLFANVRPTLINEPGFRASMIDRSGSQPGPSRIVFEVNEGVAVRSYELLVKGIRELREHGFRVAVDDLGAGHTNLDQVLRLQPDFLKLDLSLVRGVHQNAVKQALIESVVAMGRVAGATVIAEGVEAQEERDALISLGVTWGQGYFFARPAPGFARPAL
jgi:EAL domain-containing protein (putative c-di-GMP-specific phosphodiesterase class I)